MLWRWSAITVVYLSLVTIQTVLLSNHHTMFVVFLDSRHLIDHCQSPPIKSIQELLYSDKHLWMLLLKVKHISKMKVKCLELTNSWEVFPNFFLFIKRLCLTVGFYPVFSLLPVGDSCWWNLATKSAIHFHFRRKSAFLCGVPIFSFSAC